MGELTATTVLLTTLAMFAIGWAVAVPERTIVKIASFVAVLFAIAFVMALRS